MAATFEATLVAVTPSASGPPTYTEVCPLAWSELVLLDELGGAGLITLSVQVDTIDPAGKARLRDLTLAPCELWIRRTTSFTASTIVAAGIVEACRIVGRTLTIQAPGLLDYLRYWLVEADYAVVGVDQATIVQQLCDTWQAAAYGNDGIVTTGLTATGVVRTLTLAARDGKFVYPVITEMGGRNNGFDLTVDPSTRKLTMWSPRKGSDLTNSVFLDARSVGKPDVSWTVAPGSIGSEVFASSSSTTGSALYTTASNAALRATFGRSYIARSYQDISDPTTLQDYANRALVDTGTQLYTLAPELIPVSGFGYGDFSCGDQITYDVDAGLGRQTFPVRVASIETTLTSGREMLRVGML